MADLDLTGERFGKLVVTARVANRGRHRYWQCRCDCGREWTAGQENLRAGRTQSCGCVSHRHDRENWAPGNRFGRLTLLEVTQHPGEHRKRQAWRCRCDCGAETVVRSLHLQTGRIRSCGCLQREETQTRYWKHGDNRSGLRTPEYRTWLHLKHRCTNPRDPKWKDYGGRGITVCDRWLNSFEDFLADMGRRPSDKSSIDRIDNDGGYAPGNCRWATPTEQARNKRIHHR